MLILVHGKGNPVCGTDYKVGMEWAPHPPLPKTTGKKKSIWYGARELITIGWDQRGQKERMQEQEEEETRITRLFQQGRDKAVIPKKHENNFFVLFKIFL